MLMWAVGLLGLAVTFLGAAIDAKCPDDTWTRHSDGSCLKVFKSPKEKTWFAARQDCQRYGGDLLEIRDKLTNEFVTETIQALGANERYYIGASDQDMDGVYSYLNGDPLSYHNWRWGEPRVGTNGKANCVEIIANKNGRWKQKPCFRPRSYICNIKETKVGKWDNLKVTWGSPGTPGFFNPVPRTVQDALAQGFKKISDCDLEANWRGSRYIKDNDHALILLYDVNGYIAGIQTRVPEQLDTGYPFSNIRPPFIKEDDNNNDNNNNNNNNNNFVLTAYFVHPNIICTTGRTAADFAVQGTGTDLFIQSGTKPETDSVKIPLKESNIGNTKWTKGKCMPTMGVHYWYDTSEDMDCQNFYPVFLLYNKGELNSFGWAMITDLTSDRLEHPPRQVLPRFFDPVPTCLYGYENKTTTMHIYMTSNVFENKC